MKNELLLSLSNETYFFVGKKPIAVLFGEERVIVKSWKNVFSVILDKCNQQCHKRLMYLRNKVAGKVRVFISDKPDGLRSPIKIDDNLYAACGYGAATMMHILRDLLLSPAGFDYSNIRIAIRY